MTSSGLLIDQGRLRPIETVYNGYRFRSRLEARWAVFFDALGIKYDYEPEGFNLGDGLWYLPDFFLHGVLRVWVEIKGTEPDENEVLKATLLAQQSNDWVIIVWDTLDPKSLIEFGRAANCMAFYTTGHGLFRSVKGSGMPAITAQSSPDKSIYDACVAARSARFEFGENGR